MFRTLSILSLRLVLSALLCCATFSGRAGMSHTNFSARAGTSCVTLCSSSTSTIAQSPYSYGQMAPASKSSKQSRTVPRGRSRSYTSVSRNYFFCSSDVIPALQPTNSPNSNSRKDVRLWKTNSVLSVFRR